MEITQKASNRQKYIDQVQRLHLNLLHNLPIKEVNKLIIEASKLGAKTLYYQLSQSMSKDFNTDIAGCSSCEARGMGCGCMFWK